MMIDTANISSGKVTAHIFADSIQLPKQKTPCRDLRNAGNCSSTAVPDAVLPPPSMESCIALGRCSRRDSISSFLGVVTSSVPTRHQHCSHFRHLTARDGGNAKGFVGNNPCLVGRIRLRRIAVVRSLGMVRTDHGVTGDEPATPSKIPSEK